MIIQGIDTSTLPNQFKSYVKGRTLIVDGDGPCYVAAATVKRLDTAISRFQQLILKDMFMAGAQDCRIHLTSRDSDKFGRFRVKATKPYQGNRDGKEKPSLLEPLREALTLPDNWLNEFVVFLHRDIEADDAMMQDAYVLGESGVTKSDDKDLRMTPYPYYEIKRGQVMPSQPVGWVSITHTPAGSAKLTGQGPLFFWGQMLMGDTADHIQGLRKLNDKLVGPEAAYSVLCDVNSIDVAANLVIDGYRAIDQNVVAEGWLLWLTRSRTDNVIKYFRELGLSEANRNFVEDCVLRDWVTPKEENVREYND